ncbi:MAG: sensor histidine kinase [bacterium]|nr:sensor histidine kinase [bacterium]
MSINKEIITSIEVLKTKLIDYFLLLGAVFASLVFVAGRFPLDQPDFDVYNYFDLSFIVLLYAVFIFRNSLSLAFKTGLIIATIYAAYLGDMIQNGLYSTIELIVVMIPFLAILVYKLKWAIILFIIVLLSYIAIAYGYLNGYLVGDEPHPTQLIAYKWVNNGIIFSIVSIIIALLVQKLNDSLLRIIGQQDDNYEVLKLQDQELKQNIEEKKVLLQEIHHRVKNNLAVVSGLLDLQSNLAPDDFSRATLKLSTNRILSISKVHELLYQSDDVSRIHLERYIKELAQIIIDSFNKTGKDISLQLDINIHYLSVNHGVPIGIILNELITNSLKHGFNSPQEDYVIRISAIEEANHFEIVYQDNGSGVDTSNHKKQPGLGKTLIESLLTQIEASFHLETENKYLMSFRFPKVYS